MLVPHVSTFSLISSVLERLKPEFLFSDLIALMAPDLINILACSVAVAVSTTGWSDRARKSKERESTVRDKLICRDSMEIGTSF